MNKDKYNILFIAHSSELYGAERCLLELIINLPERIKPVVIAPRPGPFLDKIRENQVECFIVPFKGWSYRKIRVKCIPKAFINMVALFNILNKLRNRKINMVYSNTLYSPLGAVIARVLSVPHIWHAHEFAHLNYREKFEYGTNYSMALVNKLSNIVVCPSNKLKENLSEFVSQKKLRRVYNGIDQATLPFSREKYRDRPKENGIKILMVGSISENKGQSDAILALNELLKNGEKAELIILGESNGNRKYIEYLKKLEKILPYDDVVKWEGFQNNAGDYMQKADVLIICSKFETFGRVAVEAMSSGCPVVASKSGGISEIIEDGANGFTYDSGNFVELANKIRLLMNDKDLYAQISKNARISCLKNFQLGTYVENIVKIMDEVMDNVTRSQ